MIHGMHSCSAVWQTCNIPHYKKRGLVTPVWKNKRDLQDCSNKSGITLLNVAGKVIAHLLLSPVGNHKLRTQRLEQSGFTPNKSTVDCFIAL
ncbi:hypothetical protein Pcinc_009076 [Petrolisthes cinctipes]|uniref:Uncharacterized protein n=1 Tax=Petrolisthes cinctipes TaxID=88211 RepID=A0AAE1KYV5_PETCI|nr:hypothetical protein Pcinc_009076 [Petrolisthes cinctipes]